MKDLHQLQKADIKTFEFLFNLQIRISTTKTKLKIWRKELKEIEPLLKAAKKQEKKLKFLAKKNIIQKVIYENQKKIRKQISQKYNSLCFLIKQRKECIRTFQSEFDKNWGKI